MGGPRRGRSLAPTADRQSGYQPRVPDPGATTPHPPAPPREAPPTDVVRRTRRRARIELRAIRGLRDGRPRAEARHDWALGAALTLLFFAILGSAVVSVRDLVGPEQPASDGAPATPPERIVFVPVPPSAVMPAAPTTPVEPPTSSPERPVVPDRSIAPGAAGGSPAVPIAPPPRQQDSTTAAGAGASSARPVVEAPRAVFPVQPCDLACEVKRGRGGVGGAGRGGLGGDRPLTTAERDSLRHDAGRRAQEAAGPPSPPSQGGITILQGLPGGGPTAAQRRRTRALDAEVSARLARIKARADSLERAARDSAAAKKP